MEWRGDEGVVGITIGTSRARAAVFEQGRVEIVQLEEGERAMPSAVLLHRLREVGKYAYLYSGTDPNLLVTSINRLIGRRYQEISGELDHLQFQAVNDRDRVRISDSLGRNYGPIELYAMLLRKMRGAVESF